MILLQKCAVSSDSRAGIQSENRAEEAVVGVSEESHNKSTHRAVQAFLKHKLLILIVSILRAQFLYLNHECDMPGNRLSNKYKYTIDSVTSWYQISLSFFLCVNLS